MSSKTEIATRITRDPGIYRGKPIIRGTRMPVELIIAFLAGGETPEQIVDDYPGLTIDDIEAAIAFTEEEASLTEFRPWSD
jgi:uncharacterized protein (DUF433 family)